MPINWCSRCNGRGWILERWFKRTVCPTCKQETDVVAGGYMHPIPPRPPAPPPPPKKSGDDDLMQAGNLARLLLAGNVRVGAKSAVQVSEQGIRCLSCLSENYGVHTAGVLDNGTWYCPAHAEKFRREYEDFVKRRKESDNAKGC